MLADGKVIVTGGDDAAKTSIYDPATATWRNYTEMNKARGYQVGCHHGRNAHVPVWVCRPPSRATAHEAKTIIPQAAAIARLSPQPTSISWLYRSLAARYAG